MKYLALVSLALFSIGSEAGRVRIAEKSRKIAEVKPSVGETVNALQNLAIYKASGNQTLEPYHAYAFTTMIPNQYLVVDLNRDSAHTVRYKFHLKDIPDPGPGHWECVDGNYDETQDGELHRIEMKFRSNGTYSTSNSSKILG